MDDFNFNSARRYLREAAEKGEVTMDNDKIVDVASKEGRALVSLWRWIVSLDKKTKDHKQAVPNPDQFLPPRTGDDW